MPRQSEAKIITILGMRRCGKSTLTHILAESHKRKIVFDTVNEWHGTHTVRSFLEFTNIWREVFHQDDYTIVVKFGIEHTEDQIVETQTKITELIYRTGTDSEIETTIIFEEVQFYLPNNGLHHINKHLLTTGRHAFINIIANSQRPALISKALISQSEEIYIGPLYEMNDIKYLHGTIGDLSDIVSDLPMRTFLYYPVGKPENITLIEI